ALDAAVARQARAPAEAVVCVQCEAPAAAYRCRGAGGSKPNAFACVSQIAGGYGHERCAVRRVARQLCNGADVLVTPTALAPPIDVRRPVGTPPTLTDTRPADPRDGNLSPAGPGDAAYDEAGYPRLPARPATPQDGAQAPDPSNERDDGAPPRNLVEATRQAEDATRDAVRGVGDGVNDVGRTVGRFVRKNTEQVGETLEDAGRTVTDAVETTGEAVKDAAKCLVTLFSKC
ncbi:MAG: hypothetical protein AAFO79_08530, partial [Pseudomonadota bacterium]